jgi:hypothetical protein
VTDEARTVEGDPSVSVILLRTGDSTRARLVRELLEGAGIAVSTPGLEHRSLLGVLGGYVDIVVRVPSKDLERAKELLAAYEATDSAPTEPLPKLKRIAVFAACVIPGGGHAYARAWLGAAIVLALHATAWIAVLGDVTLAIALVPLVYAADIAGATWHCDRTQSEHAPASTVRRFAPELAALGVGVWVAAATYGPIDAWIAGGAARSFCGWRSECSAAFDERECLHDEAAHRLDRRGLLPECAECLRTVGGCDDLLACSECWE